MEHKTIFWPYNETFKGHMESCCLPVTCLRDSEDPKITSQSYLLFKYCRQTRGIPGAMLPYCFLFQYFECISFPGCLGQQKDSPQRTHGGIYFGHTKLQRLELRHSQSWRKGAAAWVHWIQIVPVDWHIVWMIYYTWDVYICKKTIYHLYLILDACKFMDMIIYKYNVAGYSWCSSFTNHLNLSICYQAPICLNHWTVERYSL